MQLFVHTANLNRCFHPERRQRATGPSTSKRWGELLSEGLASFHTSRRQHHWCIRQRPAWWHGEILVQPKNDELRFGCSWMGLELPWVPDSGMEEPFKRWKMCMFDFFFQKDAGWEWDIQILLKLCTTVLFAGSMPYIFVLQFRIVNIFGFILSAMKQ